MSNIVTTNVNTNVVQITSPGPLGPRGAAGPAGPTGTITGNTGVNSTGSSIFSGSVTVIGTLTVTGSNTFINIGPARFTGSVGISGSLSATSASSEYFTGSFYGSGAGLTGIPSSAISGLNLTRIAVGVVSASVSAGGTSFTLNNGASNLFTVNSSGLGTFLNGLTVNGAVSTFNQGLAVNGAAGTFNQGLTVNNVAANLNAGVAIQGTATLNGSAILTAGSLSTNRITDSNISASVSSTGKAFSVNNNATVLASIDQSGAISGSGVNISGSNTLINSPTIALIGAATLNGQPITTAGDLTLNQIKSGIVTASVSTGANSFILESGGTTLFRVSNTGVLSGSGANLFNIPASGITGLNLSQIATGSITSSVSTGQNSLVVQSGSTALMTVSSSGYVSASGFIGDGSRLSNVGITYLSGSNPLINSIQVADFDNNVAVTYVNGNLKFIFGTPTPPSSPSVNLSGFATDRFNKQSDSYNTLASWDVGGYTLVSAKLYYTVTGQLLDSTTTGTSFNVVQTTTGSGQTYRVEVTSSSPLDGAISQLSSTTTGTLSKSRPDVPTISITSNTVQLGISSNQIEEGATGDIAFSAAYGAANAWETTSLTTIPSSSPQSVSSPTSTISISATSNYQSPAGANDPQITDSRSSTTTYSRIRSLRYGATTTTSFTEADLQDLEIWDTSLGGTIGTIAKGTVNPSGQSVTITWTGDKYHYIVISSAYTLSNITTGGFGVLSAFTATVVGNYRVYKSNTLQSGGAGTSITYVLT
jgi:hypothetical protein